MSSYSIVPARHVPATAWGGAIAMLIAVACAVAVASVTANVAAVLSQGVADLLVALL